jgi:hypothetical protein
MATFAVVTAGLSIIPALPSVAQESLSAYLDRAGSAEYRAEQIVSCSTPDGPRDSVVDIVQADGLLVAGPATGEGETVEVGAGTLKAEGSGIAVGPDGGADLDDHYTIGSTRSVVVSGRNAEEVAVVGSTGITRARLSFDVDSGALVQSTVMNADGSVWCDMHLVDVETGPITLDGVDLPSTALDGITPPSDPRLPEVAAGMDRLDVYEWPDRGIVGYYSDGLLSFTVLASPRPLVLTAPDTVTIESGNGTVTRWHGPGSVALSWESSEGGIAVFGDVPMDVQDRILSDLPAAHSPNVLSRLWRNLFD